MRSVRKFRSTIRAFVSVGAISAILVNSGCSLFVGSTQPVTISASDPEADIFVNGQHEGTGMVTVKLERNQSHGVMAKVGNRAGSAHIGTKISTTGVLDIIGGLVFLVPFLGVLGPGFWTLDRQQVQIAIPPAS